MNWHQRESVVRKWTVRLNDNDLMILYRSMEFNLWRNYSTIMLLTFIANTVMFGFVFSTMTAFRVWYNVFRQIWRQNNVGNVDEANVNCYEFSISKHSYTENDPIKWTVPLFIYHEFALFVSGNRFYYNVYQNCVSRLELVCLPVTCTSLCCIARYQWEVRYIPPRSWNHFHLGITFISKSFEGGVGARTIFSETRYDWGFFLTPVTYNSAIRHLLLQVDSNCLRDYCRQKMSSDAFNTPLLLNFIRWIYLMRTMRNPDRFHWNIF